MVVPYVCAYSFHSLHADSPLGCSSSTLENWCREFQRFAPNIKFNTYYGAKDDRPALRQELLENMASKNVDDGWEVLITTYNLAQGDEKDRKFFRRVAWDVGDM